MQGHHHVKTKHSGYLMMFVYTVLMLGKINSVEVRGLKLKFKYADSG